MKAARGGLRKAIALAYYGGLRKKDCVEVERAARAQGQINLAQSKTGSDLTLFEAKRLKDVLDEPDKVPGSTIVVNARGEPYTRDGLDSVFDQLKRGLVDKKLIRAGLTFHGLRKSLGKRAAERASVRTTSRLLLGMPTPPVPGPTPSKQLA